MAVFNYLNRGLWFKIKSLVTNRITGKWIVPIKEGQSYAAFPGCYNNGDIMRKKRRKSCELKDTKLEINCF